MTPLGFFGGALCALLASATLRTPVTSAQDFAIDVSTPAALYSPRPDNSVLLVFDPGSTAGALRDGLTESFRPLAKLAKALDLPLVSVHPKEQAPSAGQHPIFSLVPKARQFERKGPHALAARGLERAINAKDVIMLGSLHDGDFVVSLLDLLREHSENTFFVADLARDEPDAAWFLTLERVVAAGAVPMSLEHFAVDLVDSWSSKDGDAVRDLLDED